ncbi:MAG: NAD-dependent DNA ligase LigA [Candidatus Jorgensenbacteria bacterium]|nr:NAD-dependent DNA ligase LigA [Candidatus Jorgensenbacteria bacterium]
MDNNEAKTRIEKLRKEINKYRYAYHVLDKQLISDEALDSLKKELFDLELKFPDLITPDSPTRRVGGEPLKAFKKVRHEEPMISLNDTFSREDVKDWLKRTEKFMGEKVKEFYCELKLDGFSIELTYENGVFVEGSTRGNGIIGENVTQNLKTVEAIPLTLFDKDEVEKNMKALGLRASSLAIPKKLVVRGEVFLTTKEFERINREQGKKEEKLYANPRNIAAGSIRQLDPKIAASRKLDSYQYDLVTDVGQKTHEEEHLILRAFGFKTNPHNKKVNSLDGIFTFRDHWEKNRKKLPYEIDGTVIIINENRLAAAAGVVGKAPRGAIAYKFAPKEKTTIVKDIKIQVGRTGVLTPVAVLEPVEVGGVRISHATLHNFDEIGRLGIKIGDTVVVSRAGDVIPQITKVLVDLRTGKEKKFTVPEKCPVDGSRVIHEGALYRCSNPKCGARVKESLSHFVSRHAFDIRGLGEEIIDRFLDEGLIADAADIFKLEKGDISVLERFGEKSAENITREIETKKTIKLERFIFSLGIQHVGEETAILLAREFPPSHAKTFSVADFKKKFENLSAEEVQKVSGIGPKVAESIVNWFKEDRNIKLLCKFGDVDIKLESEREIITNKKLKGKTFVVTGTLSVMSRDEAKQKIRSYGGDVSESVSSKTSYVVAGENPGSKFDKAKELGVKIITEREFLELLK